MQQAKSVFGLAGVAVILTMLITSVAFSDEAARSVWPNFDPSFRSTPPTPHSAYGQARGQNYGGNLKVFLTEPRGRWSDSQGRPFGYAFLNFIIDVPVNLVPFQEYTYTDTLYWYNTTAEGIFAIAAVYNSVGHTNYSDPPSGFPFLAHYADAVAGAGNGEVGQNESGGGFTHTVIAEDGSTTW